MAVKVQTASTNILELAKRGDLEAIAILINRALQPKGIKAQVALEESNLILFLEAIDVPDQRTLVPFLQQGITNLGIQVIRTITVCGQQVGQPEPDWQQTITVESPPTVVLEPQSSYSSNHFSSNGSGARPADGASSRQNGSATAVAPISTVDLENQLRDSASGQRMAIGKRILHITKAGSMIVSAAPNGQPVLQSRPAPVPLLYCRPMPELLDRRSETEGAIASLKTGFPVEFVGEPGAGKTALLRSLAYHPQITATFRDGVVYHPVRRQPVADLIQTLFDDFFEYDSDIPVKPTDAEIFRAFQEKRALAVLDDVDLSPENIEQLRTLPGLTVLAAGQERHAWGEVNAIPVAGLPIADALVLIEQALGRSLTLQERPQAVALCNLLKGHPLRILQAVTLVRQDRQPFSALVQLLRDAALPDVLTLKIAASLAEPERQALAVLAVLNGTPIYAEHLSALTGIAQIQPVLTTLTQRNLVLSDGSRYVLTNSAIEALRQIWDLSHWSQRTLTYFVNWATQHGPFADELLKEAVILQQIAELAVNTRQWSQVLRLAYLMDTPLILGGKWGAWEQMWQWGLLAGRSLNDTAAVAYALHQLGSRALCLDDFFTAHTYLIDALRSRQALRDAPGAATTRHNLALLLSSPAPAEPAPAPLPAQPPVRPSHPILKGVIVAGVLVAVGGLMLWFLDALPRSPRFVLSATRLGFGSQSLNTTSSKQTIYLTNTGSKPLTLSSVTPSGANADDFQVAETCTTAPIAPAEDCTIDVTFTPQAEGSRVATVAILDQSGKPSQELLLSGIGKQPDSPFVLSFSPGNVTFAKQTVNIQSRAQSIRVANTGSIPIEIAQLRLTGDQAADFRSTDDCVGTILEPKDTCTVEVLYTPKAVGSSQASLVITASGRDSLPGDAALSSEPPPFWNIPLSGTGIAPAPKVPRVSLSLRTLSFGDEVIDTSSDRALVVTNTGEAPLRIRDLSIAGEQARDFFIIENSCTQRAIAPSDDCTIVARFAPRGGGDRTASLVITDNTARSPHTVSLTGFGQRAGTRQRTGTGEQTGSEQREPVAPSSSPTSVSPPPSIISFIASPSEITAGESTQLCYGVNNANSALIDAIGQVEPLENNCISVQPSQTTTYTLTVTGNNGQQLAGETTVRVSQADLGPPTVPEALTPGSSEPSQAPDLLSCKNSTPLRWQPGSGGSQPTNYVLTLQTYVYEQQQWVTVLEDQKSSATDVTPLLKQSENYRWRWTVRSLDAQGRQSDPAPWQYFTCYDFG